MGMKIVILAIINGILANMMAYALWGFVAWIFIG